MLAAGLPTLLLQPMKLCLLLKAHQETWGEVGRSGSTARVFKWNKFCRGKRKGLGASGDRETQSAPVIGALRWHWHTHTLYWHQSPRQISQSNTFSFMGDGPTPPRWLRSLVILVYNVALGAEATRQEHTYLSIVKSTFLRKRAWHQTTMTLTYFNTESGEPGLYPSNRKQLWYLSEAKKKTCQSLLQTKRLIPGRARPRLQIAKRFVDRIFACTTPIYSNCSCQNCSFSAWHSNLSCAFFCFSVSLQRPSYPEVFWPDSGHVFGWVVFYDFLVLDFVPGVY